MEFCYDEFKCRSLTPAFLALRQSGVHASTQNVPCCSHGSYICYTAKRLPYKPIDKLYLRHSFANAAVQERALSILRRFCDVEWDGEPTTCICVRPKPSRWVAVHKWVRGRAIGVYWLGLTSHLYASGGIGCKRDRADFEAEMQCVLGD